MYRIIFLTLLVASTASYAQKMPLEPGTPFPYQGNLRMEGSDEIVTINSFKGKYVLVDLFARHCVACFYNLPKLDSFNKEFKQLKIVLIGKKEGALPEIYERFKKRFDLNLSVVLDTLPFKYVRYFFLPTYVWIGPDGLVKAVTGPEKVTRENVTAFISGESLPFAELIRPDTIDTTKDFLSSNNEEAGNYLVRTIFGKWNPKQPLYYSGHLDFPNGTKRIFMLGFTMQNFYYAVQYGVPSIYFGDSLYNTVFNKLEVEGPVDNLEEKYNFSISYNGNKPPITRDILAGHLRQQFGYEYSVEKKLKPYFSVTLDPKFKDSLRSKGNIRKKHSNHIKIDYRNVRVSDLLSRVKYYTSLMNDLPVIDETGIDFNIDINIEAVMTELDDLFTALRKKGIVIVQKQKEMEVIVLRPVGDGNKPSAKH